MKKKILNLDTFGIILITFLILVFIVITLAAYFISKNSIILNGPIAEEFCSDKCGDKDYYASVNDSNHKVIECECVAGLEQGDGKYQSTVKVKSSYIYFDSITLEEISRKEVRAR